MHTTTTIRVNTELYKAIKAVAENEKINLQQVIERSLNDYKKHRFWAEFNSGWQDIRNDDIAWKEEMQERDDWIKLSLI